MAKLDLTFTIPAPVPIEYDALADVLTIAGVRYSLDLFRHLGVGGLTPGTWVRIVSREDGKVTLTYRNECPTCGPHDTRDRDQGPA